MPDDLKKDFLVGKGWKEIISVEEGITSITLINQKLGKHFKVGTRSREDSYNKVLTKAMSWHILDMVEKYNQFNQLLND